jgi:hypothetical protein
MEIMKKEPKDKDDPIRHISRDGNEAKSNRSIQ